MREHHNIVGSEVGHARPPIYFRAGHSRRSRRRGGSLLITALVLVVLAGAALVALERGVADGDADLLPSWPPVAAGEAAGDAAEREVSRKADPAMPSPYFRETE